jgi:hypothetical protein
MTSSIDFLNAVGIEIENSMLGMTALSVAEWSR